MVAARNAERESGGRSHQQADFLARHDQTPSHHGSARFVPLDLANFSSVDVFVEAMFVEQQQEEQEQRHGPIAGVVLNAGIIALDGWGVTKADGMERVLQVNHLAHQHLVVSLLEQGKHAPSTAISRPLRVVSVSSWMPSRNAARGSPRRAASSTGSRPIGTRWKWSP